VPKPPTCLAVIARVLLVLLSTCSPTPAPDLADIHLSNIPDLPQLGPQFGSVYASEMLCAPVAVSNSLMWLQDNFSRPDQIALVDKLAHYRYMATSPHQGTGPTGVLFGVEKYLKEFGLEFRRLEYAGIRTVPDRFRAGGKLSLAWLHSGLAPRSAVWLNLGWYSQLAPGVYRREFGHWVTLVGFKDGKLLVHDPGPWQAAPEPLAVVSNKVWLLDAQEWYLAPTVLELSDAPGPGYDYTLLDGAVILTVNP